MTETWTLLFSLLSLRATLLVSELLVAAKVHDFVLFTQSSLFVGFRCHLIGMVFYAHALCLRFRTLLFCAFQIGRLSVLLSWIRLWINGEVYPSSFNSSTETQEYEFHGNRCPTVAIKLFANSLSVKVYMYVHVRFLCGACCIWLCLLSSFLFDVLIIDVLALLITSFSFL